MHNKLFFCSGDADLSCPFFSFSSSSGQHGSTAKFTKGTAQVMQTLDVANSPAFTKGRAYIISLESEYMKSQTLNWELAPSWLDSSIGRALHPHRRGHGFESRSSLNFFQAFFSQLLKLRT